jgi:hypothetical protein
MREVVVTYLCVLGVIVLYGLFRLRLIYATQSYRINAARLADDLLDDPRLSDIHHRMLVAGIQHAFDGTQPWKFLKTVVGLLASRRAFPWDATDPDEPDDPELRRKLDKAIGGMTIATFALSPLATLLIVIVMTFGLLAHASVSTIWHATLRAMELSFLARTGQARELRKARVA